VKSELNVVHISNLATSVGWQGNTECEQYY